jgi:hypothetical protein
VTLPRLRVEAGGETNMSASGWIHLDFERIVRETDKALLVRLEDGEEVWLPLSQISEPDSYREGDENGTISVTEWIAEQKGLL